YQAERERIAPRKRVFLDFAHQHARTLDGREIHVIASVTKLDDVPGAMDNGADGLYVPSGAGLLSAGGSVNDHLLALRDLIDLGAGKPITIEGAVDDTVTHPSPTALLRASQSGDITLALDLEHPQNDLPRVEAHLDAVEDELIGEDIDSGRPQVALSLK